MPLVDPEYAFQVVVIVHTKVCILHQESLVPVRQVVNHLIRNFVASSESLASSSCVQLFGQSQAGALIFILHCVKSVVKDAGGRQTLLICTLRDNV